MRYLDRAKNALIPAPVMIAAERDGITVEVALTWNDSYHESMLAFTNNIPQRDGGTHLAGFRAGADPRGDQICRRDARRQKKDKVALTGDDCREGLTCVLSVKVPDPKFSSQTKDKLVSSRSAPGGGRRGDRPAGRAGSRSIPPKPRPSSARWWKPPPPAKPRARRAN